MALLLFFTKKRMLIKKLRSYVGVIRFNNHISKRKKLLKRKTGFSDDEILKSFSCSIETPLEVSETENIEKFNKLLRNLCKLVGVGKESENM